VNIVELEGLSPEVLATSLAWVPTSDVQNLLCCIDIGRGYREHGEVIVGV